MEASEFWALQSAESDAKANICCSLNAASVTNTETVINSKTDSALVKEQKSDEELLEGLFTEHYCHVCSCNLLFESNRQAHYEGKKHAQEVKTYLNAVRAELARACQTMSRDKNRFCDLCNMVFNSHVVAKSHYEGKIHAKKLRNQSLPTPDKFTNAHNSSSMTQDPSDQNSSLDDNLEPPPDPTPTPFIPDPSAFSNTEVDLRDPDKYCTLCAASFNRPEMAWEHYKGRKHQKKKARQELIKDLGKSLMCEICGVSYTSIETYQAHMKGNKHQIREKKFKDIFKSQPKVYSTFADELADYIQVQKARGITPKTSQVLPEESAQNDDDEGQEEVQHEDLNAVSMPSVPQTAHPPLQPPPGTWSPFCPVPSWPPFGWPYVCPPAPFPYPGFTQFNSWPADRGQQRRLSTSSSSSTSSSTCTSDMSDASDNDEGEHTNKKRGKTKRNKGDKERKEGDAETEEQQRRRKRQRMERDYDSGERRREQCVESWEEGRRKRPKGHLKRTQKQKIYLQENFETVKGGRTANRLDSQAKSSVEWSKSGHSKSANNRREEKTKDDVDERTEDEKLWDESILGF